MNFTLLADNLFFYVNGFWQTILLTFSSLGVGYIFAWGCALILYKSRKKSDKGYYHFFAKWIINPYIYYFCGTPALIQIYLIYYGLGQFEIVKNSFLWFFFQNAFFCAWFALTLNTAAYTARILEGALNSYPTKLRETIDSLSFSKLQRFFLFVFPYSFRVTIPTYANEAVFLMQATSLASSITIVELTQVARVINSKFYAPFEAFITVAIFYLILSYMLTGLLKLLESKLSYPGS